MAVDWQYEWSTVAAQLAGDATLTKGGLAKFTPEAVTARVTIAGDSGFSAGPVPPMRADSVTVHVTVPDGGLTVSESALRAEAVTVHARSSGDGHFEVPVAGITNVVMTASEAMVAGSTLSRNRSVTMSIGGTLGAGAQSPIVTCSMPASGVTLGASGGPVFPIEFTAEDAIPRVLGSLKNSGVSMPVSDRQGKQKGHVPRVVRVISQTRRQKVPTAPMFMGQALSVSATTGLAMPLVEGELFIGFALVVSGAWVMVAEEGQARLEVVGVTGPADYGKPVYAKDDATFQLASNGPKDLVGRIKHHLYGRWCIVRFWGVPPFAGEPI